MGDLRALSPASLTIYESRQKRQKLERFKQTYKLVIFIILLNKLYILGQNTLNRRFCLE
jgi:hypothetical protein